MRYRWKPCIWLVSILFIVSGLSGCSIPPLPTSMPLIGDTPSLTPAQPLPSLTPQPAPTATDIPSPVPLTPLPTLQLSQTTYHHANDLFELFPPLGWEIQEDDSSVSFTDPLGTGFIYLQVTNTGRELDQAALKNFVAAREANFFGKYESYVDLSQQIDPEKHIGSVSKSLVFEGKPMSVVTFYDQKGQAVYAVDFWAEANAAASYTALFDDLFNQIIVDSSLAAALEPYSWVYEFRSPDGLLSLNVPTSWSHSFRQDTGMRADRFISPDGRAEVQVTGITPGNPVDLAGLADLAMQSLKQEIAADIQLSTQEIQPDGSLLLTWETAESNRLGTTTAQIADNKLILFSSLYAGEDREIFEGLLDFIRQSFQIP